jgi:pSer/pThr/pTyr-binding forkhead associated (FHA) protein
MSNHRVITIGRSEDNDIVIDETSVSRYHLRIFVDEENTVFVTDLNSTNGTYINGNRISGTQILQKNDILKAGYGRRPIQWMRYVTGEIPSRISQGVLPEEKMAEMEEKWLMKGVLLTFAYLIGLAVLIFVLFNFLLKK